MDLLRKKSKAELLKIYMYKYYISMNWWENRFWAANKKMLLKFKVAVFGDISLY